MSGSQLTTLRTAEKRVCVCNYTLILTVLHNHLTGKLMTEHHCYGKILANIEGGNERIDKRCFKRQMCSDGRAGGGKDDLILCPLVEN